MPHAYGLYCRHHSGLLRHDYLCIRMRMSVLTVGKACPWNPVYMRESFVNHISIHAAVFWRSCSTYITKSLRVSTIFISTLQETTHRYVTVISTRWQINTWRTHRRIRQRQHNDLRLPSPSYTKINFLLKYIRYYFFTLTFNSVNYFYIISSVRWQTCGFNCWSSGWTSMELHFHPGPARQLSTNLYDVYHCWVYNE